MGPPTNLSDDEEGKIVNWILSNAKVGFPIHPEQVKDAIPCVLNESLKKNSFTYNRPGSKWFNLFMKIHPEIKKETLK